MAEMRSDYGRTYLEDIVGKTVGRVARRGDQVAIFFADKTFVYLEADKDWDATLIADDGEIGRYDAKELGIIDDEEYRRLGAEQERERSDAERREYERLRAKYEGPAA
jgi:hypothetical protein